MYREHAGQRHVTISDQVMTQRIVADVPDRPVEVLVDPATS